MSLKPANDAAQTAEVARQMQALRKRYVEKLADSIVLLEAGLRACDERSLDTDQREAIRACGHRLAGTGATYGFPAISQTGRRLDDALKANPMIPADRLKALLEDLYRACAEARLPPTQEPVTPASDAHAGPGRLKPRRLPILLAADDDEAILALFSQVFADQFEIVTARNSDEALRLMRHYRPDVVLLDDIMPDSITGLRFLELLQKTGEFADTPIIMVTASDAEADIERGLKAGASGYITKPFDPAVVVAKVHRVLAQD